MVKFYIGSGMKNCELVNYYVTELQKEGWHQTYNWVENVNNDIDIDDMREYAKLEKQGIVDADVVIILLSAGRGAHIELGMAMALGKKVYLCSATEEEFALDNTVAFYELSSIVKLIGTADENLKQILI